MYTGEGDTTRLECSLSSSLDQDVLSALLARLSPDPSSADFVTPPTACAPMCSDQAAQTRLLRELPTLDDIDIAARQKGDKSRGDQIPGAVVASSQWCKHWPQLRQGERQGSTSYRTQRYEGIVGGRRCPPTEEGEAVP
jgi:hypothetical protein